MESKWYESFFYGLAVELWGKVMSTEQTSEEVDFAVSTLNLSKEARLIDVPCGLGRHSIELSRRGYRMTGVDLSEQSIAEARRNADLAGLPVDWVHGDMVLLDRSCGGEPFDGALCFGNSFGYMDYDTTMDFLRALHRCLKTGAGFLLDTGLAAESLLPNLPTRRWYKVEDMYMLSEAAYDAPSSQLRVHYTFMRGAEVQTGAATYFLYTVAELKRLLAACGLQVQGLYGTTKGDPYLVGNQRLLLVARKV